jgi:hypothetical protein
MRIRRAIGDWRCSARRALANVRDLHRVTALFNASTAPTPRCRSDTKPSIALVVVSSKMVRTCRRADRPRPPGHRSAFANHRLQLRVDPGQIGNLLLLGGKRAAQ